MKLKTLNIIFGLFIAACSITSCLDTDYTEYELSSNSSITAFSITDSIITKYAAVVNGKDTTLSKAVVGSDYPFVIDQGEGLIYNLDSLPVGTDVSKVVVDITADTQGIFIVAETDSLWEAEDSLNFEKPIQFKILAENGTFGHIYTAKINVHKQEPDLLNWVKIEGNFSKNIQKQKAVYANNSIYVFAENGTSVLMTKAKTDNGSEWSEPIQIGISADYSSAMAWGGQLYILAQNELYTSTDGLEWKKVNTEQRFSQLLASIDSQHNHKMVGIDTENSYIESEDGLVWNCHGSIPSNFPMDQFASTSFALDTNDKLERIVLIGDNKITTDTTNIVWTQLNMDNEWVELTIENNKYACPKLENSGIIHYNNTLYIFGGAGQYNGTVEAFSKFYASVDDGICWKEVTKNFMFPEIFSTLYEQANGNYSYIVDDQHFIWIMWSQTGEVWRGRVNKLGFEKQ
jgi:hypothetical protein